MGKVVEMNEKPKFPELFTDEEVAEYGTIITTTDTGCVFMKKDGKMNMFQPVATKHSNNEDYYYTRMEFK